MIDITASFWPRLQTILVKRALDTLSPSAHVEDDGTAMIVVPTETGYQTYTAENVRLVEDMGE